MATKKRRRNIDFPDDDSNGDLSAPQPEDYEEAIEMGKVLFGEFTDMENEDTAKGFIIQMTLCAEAIADDDCEEANDRLYFAALYMMELARQGDLEYLKKEKVWEGMEKIQDDILDEPPEISGYTR